MSRPQIRQEIIRFAIVGAVATAIHYGVYLLLSLVVDVNVAYTVGYVASFLVNYLLSAAFTFREGKSVECGIGFTIAHLFNYLLRVSLLNLFIWLSVPPAYAPIPVYCIAVPTNFILVRTVFRRL